MIGKYLLPDWKAARRWWSMHVVGVGFVFSAIKAGLVAAARAETVRWKAYAETLETALKIPHKSEKP